jgi:hypothetical protein
MGHRPRHHPENLFITSRKGDIVPALENNKKSEAPSMREAFLTSRKGDDRLAQSMSIVTLIPPLWMG